MQMWMYWPSENLGVAFALTAVEEAELDLKISRALVIVGYGFFWIQVFSSVSYWFSLRLIIVSAPVLYLGAAEFLE